MMAIEYTDMISRMITTVIATAPMLLNILLMLSSLPGGLAAGLACQRKTRRPNAFVPRMLVRIVTVTPPKRFDYINCLPAIRTERWLLSVFPGATSAPDCLLRHKVVDDHAINLDRLPGKLGGRELR